MPIEIAFPREGDILQRCDGTETDSGLTIEVRGTADSRSSVHVNGVEARMNGGAFDCEITLAQRRNVVTATDGSSSQTIEVWWNKGSRPRFRFSVDDNIQFLKELGLAPSNYPSLFDHWYLGFWRDMHVEFGAKIHINIYYQTDGFDLTQMPAMWKNEWRENASWLHLSFHALQDQPERPYRNAGYLQMAHDHDLVCSHIRRFAGEEVLSNTTTVHWAECPKPAARALRDRGIEVLIGLFTAQGYPGDCTTRYYLTPEQCAHCDTRGAWHDRETGITFVRCTSVVNALKLEEIEPYLDAHAASPSTNEMVELLIHEQYFRKELSYYQPDAMEKVRTALRWVTRRGHVPVFWSDGDLGIE